MGRGREKEREGTPLKKPGYRPGIGVD